MDLRSRDHLSRSPKEAGRRTCIRVQHLQPEWRHHRNRYPASKSREGISEVRSAVVFLLPVEVQKQSGCRVDYYRRNSLPSNLEQRAQQLRIQSSQQKG